MMPRVVHGWSGILEGNATKSKKGPALYRQTPDQPLQWPICLSQQGCVKSGSNGQPYFWKAIETARKTIDNRVTACQKSLRLIKIALEKADGRTDTSSTTLKQKLDGAEAEVEKYIEEFDNMLTGDFDWTFAVIAKIKVETNAKIKEVNEYMSAIGVCG